MIRTCVKGSIKLIILIGLVLTCLFVASEFLRPIDIASKDNTQEKVKGFYALDENTLNVLFLGTSHSYYSLNPAILWHETGLTSYMFGGQCQPIELTYTYIVEALKTQLPEVVVLDIFALSQQSTMCQTEGTYRVNIQDLKLSENKYDAYKLLENQDPLENIFDVSLYHERITEIDWNQIENPFIKKFNPNFGYTLSYPDNLITWERNELDIKEKITPDMKRMEYLVKIVELLEEENIPLILIKTPYYIDDMDAKIYNSIWDFANQRSIKVIDFNQKLTEMNFIFDLDGDSWHTNARGAMKVTKYIANMLEKEFSFKNSYSNYDDQYRVAYAKTLYAIYSRTVDIEELLSYFDTTGVTVLINYDKVGPISMSNEIVEAMQNLGLDFSKNKQMIVYKDNDFDYHEDEIIYNIKEHEYKLSSTGDLWIDGQIVNNQEKSLKFVVIDNETGYPVDNFQVDCLDQIYIYRR